MKKILLTALALGVSWWASAVTPEELTNQLYLQIVSACNAQDWEQVTGLVEQLIDAGADVDEFEVNYGRALAQSGRADEAVSRLTIYLEKYGDDFQAWYVLADAQASLSHTDEAIEAYEKCAEMNPMSAAPYVAIARLYGVGNPAVAVDAYCKAMRICLLAEKPHAAFKLGSEAMDIDQSSSQLMILIGESLSQLEMEDDALGFYADAVRIASNPEALDMETIGVGTGRIGLILFEKGDYAKSLVFLSILTNEDDLLATLAPDMAQELVLLAAADNQKLGQSAEAEALLEKARAINPESDIDDYYQSLLQLGQ